MTNPKHTDTSRSGDLVKRLRGFYCGDMGEPADPINPDGPEAADRIEALEAENERLQKELDRRIVDGIHTCHDECPRLLCFERRENERLREVLEQFLALIKHQYFGSREAMNALQEADNAARAALGEG